MKPCAWPSNLNGGLIDVRRPRRSETTLCDFNKMNKTLVNPKSPSAEIPTRALAEATQEPVGASAGEEPGFRAASD